MEKNFKRTLITTALPYANGPVHIGHLAGVYVPADIYARYLRLQGRDVLMIGGSDEHGVPITLRARREGVTPQDIVDRYHASIKKSLADLGISFDVYSRTTSDIHTATASEFFTRLLDKGEFTVKTSLQPYDETAGEFLADRYVTGETGMRHNSLPTWLSQEILYNWLLKPDFIAYNYLTAEKTRLLALSRRLWHTPCVAWTVRQQEKEPLALARFDAVIFEGYRPETHFEPQRTEDNASLGSAPV